MTLILENGTSPGIECKSMSIGDFNDVRIGNLHLPFQAFFELAYVYFVDLDIVDDDPRARFISYSKALKQVPGWGIDNFPKPKKMPHRFGGAFFAAKKVYSPYPLCVRMQGSEVSGEDFWTMVEYVLTNTDIFENDPRLPFLKAIRSMRIKNGKFVPRKGYEFPTPNVDAVMAEVGRKAYNPRKIAEKVQ